MISTLTYKTNKKEWDGLNCCTASEMEEYQASIQSSFCDEPLGHADPSPRLPPRKRRQLQKTSNVCSRAYFVVVMVFFHLYIINIIALLMFVLYNTGSGDMSNGHQEVPVATRPSVTRPPPTDHNTAAHEQHHLEHPFRLPRLEGIRVGHVQRVSIVPDQSHDMRTLSLKPLLFEIPGFLSLEECGVLMQLAQLKGLTPSSHTQESSHPAEEELSADELFNLLDLNQDGLLQREEIQTFTRSTDGSWLSAHNLREIHMGLEGNPTGVLSLQEFRLVNGGGSQQAATGRVHEGRGQLRHKSTYTWLYLGDGAHRLLQSIRSRVTRLSRLPSQLVNLSEPLEVVHYEQGGYSHAHYDSSPAHPDGYCYHTQQAANTSSLNQLSCRYVTVQLYLNSVDAGGETSFPVADNRTYEEEALEDLSQHYCTKGNLRVKPVAGAALLWYNHLSDGNGWVGEQDEFSLHGDCGVSRGSKWVGNVWVNIDPDQQRQERYQRLVSRQPTGHSEGLEHRDLHQDL